MPNNFFNFVHHARASINQIDANISGYLHSRKAMTGAYIKHLWSKPVASTERIELGISPDYIPNWTVWAGLREVANNAYDSAQTGHELVVEYQAGVLRFLNKNARLDRSSLVLGVTSKRQSKGLIGQHGDGLKSAITSLLRLGHKIVIYNQNEKWVPALEYSKTFNSVVTVINIEPHTPANTSLCVEIAGISQIAYDDMCAKLLWLNTAKVAKVETPEGSILTEASKRGHLYIKGVFVQDLPDNYQYGYNLNNVSLDRDRQMANVWEMRKEIFVVLCAAWKRGQLTNKQLYELLLAQTGEAMCMKDHSYNSLMCEDIFKYFRQIHGDTAMPVANNDEMTKATMFVLKGVICNPTLLEILKRGGGNLEAACAQRNLEAKRVWKDTELTAVELKNLNRAYELVGRVERIDLSRISVVDFYGTVLGVYQAGVFADKIMLSRSIVKELNELIATLVHEVAHRYGTDGSLEHRDAEEKIFSKIITSLI